MRSLTFTSLAGLAAAVVPNFPNQWSAFVQQDLLEAQGAHYIGNGDICCTPQDNDCQVQFQSQAGMMYFDLPNNRTSQVFGPEYTPYAIVTIFGLGKEGLRGKELAVDNTWTCQSYCPVDGPMTPYNVDGYTDMGPTTILGQNVELWQQVTEIPILNITMEVDNIYVNQKDINNPIPVIEVDMLTPFGEQLGTSNTTYSQWTAGAPDPKWFNVSGVDTCQLDSNCNQDQVRLLHRRALGRKSAYWSSILRARAERAKLYTAAADALDAARK